MDHLLSFNVNLNPEKSNYPFRNQYLHVSCSTNNSSFFHYISDNRGFFIWKSPNADYQQTYEKLLENNFCAELLDHVQDNFEFIFFDLSKQTLIIGKDSLGLYSLVYTEDPFIISSHDLQGNEHPPGFTIFNNNSKSIIAYPQFTRNPDPSLTIESTMSHLMNTLIHSVIPGSPVLFSGGLDSTLIAAALALSGAPEVELINFCALDTAPDRASSRHS
ncbi:Asparagine synthase family protein [Histomonas meleagridis]|nr:Asparagine synthase family protein [Histomonas meleagridis]